MLFSQFENIVRKHHEIHQAIGGLNVPLKIILIICNLSYHYKAKARLIGENGIEAPRMGRNVKTTLA